MYAQVEKSKDNKNRSVANSVGQKKSDGKQGFGFVDNRPVSVVQRKSQDITEVATNRNPSSMLLQLKAGVESFSVDWKKHTDNDENNAAFWIDYKAKFKNGDGFDAGDAEFRQNASDDWKRVKSNGTETSGSSPLEDDNYSKVEDPEMYNGTNKENFEGVDQPGWSDGELAEDEEVTYSFTAEQMIIDTSDSDKILEKKGPRTVTISGKHPRNHNL